MANQFCPHCGTEVDADARFCPTCGRTLTSAPEEAEETEEVATGADDGSEIPPAPAWPSQEPARAVEPEEPAEPEVTLRDEEHAAASAGEPVASPPPEPPPATGEPAGPPPAAPPPAAPPPAAPPADRPEGPSELPFTVPVMLSGWLIGAGSGFAALALLPRLGNLLSVLMFVALLWVAATVFLADRMPTFPQQRLAVLVVVMVATGAALDRAGFRVNVNSIFLVAMLVAAAGVLLVELGRDRPVQTGGSS